MAKYRKRPVVIEAEQYQPGHVTLGVCVPGVCLKGLPEGEVYFPHVHTIHQGGHVVPIEPGDWVIPEPDGIHYYPVKPDIFEATYEPVEE